MLPSPYSLLYPASRSPSPLFSSAVLLTYLFLLHSFCSSPFLSSSFSTFSHLISFHLYCLVLTFFLFRFIPLPLLCPTFSGSLYLHSSSRYYCSSSSYLFLFRTSCHSSLPIHSFPAGCFLIFRCLPFCSISLLFYFCYSFSFFSDFAFKLFSSISSSSSRPALSLYHSPLSYLLFYLSLPFSRHFSRHVFLTLAIFVFSNLLYYKFCTEIVVW